MLCFFLLKACGWAKKMSHTNKTENGKEKGKREREKWELHLWNVIKNRDVDVDKQQNRTYSLVLSTSSLTWKYISVHYRRMLKRKKRRDWRRRKKVWRIETTYWQNRFIRVFHRPALFFLSYSLSFCFSLTSNDDVLATIHFYFSDLYWLSVL